MCHRSLAKTSTVIPFQILTTILAVSGVFSPKALAGPTASAATGWTKYVAATEVRIDRELLGNAGFLRLDMRDPEQAPRTRQQLKKGDIYIRKDSNSVGNAQLDGALIHHWLGAIFIPNTTLDDVLHWVQNYNDHRLYFKDVERSQLNKRNGDTFDVYLRLVRTNIVTVRYDTYHTAVYHRHDAKHASSRSVATRIVEVSDEPGKDSGFLWRLNSYWRFSEEDNGVFVECESLSLSRSIPFGLAWLVGGYINSVPREALESTLISIRQGLTARTSAREAIR
jgi:hypothetical protein